MDLLHEEATLTHTNTKISTLHTCQFGGSQSHHLFTVHCSVEYGSMTGGTCPLIYRTWY